MSSTLQSTAISADEALDELYEVHGRRQWPGPDDLLGVLVNTLLNQQTTADLADRAFGRLLDRFGADWARIAEAPVDDIADAIRSAGLADQKARRLKGLLGQLHEQTGDYSLDHLRDHSPDEARRRLQQLRGVGPKTARFTLMYAAGMPLFPIDTNILRVVRRLGWVPADCSAARAHRIVEPAIPEGEHFGAHMALIEHGRAICTSSNPDCPDCPLCDKCPSANS